MRRMKKKFRLSNRASQDLAGIWRYTLDNWSREQANNYVNGLMNACKNVADNPQGLGRPYAHIREGYWKYQWSSHVIFFKIDNDSTISVVRILHERMDFDRHF